MAEKLATAPSPTPPSASVRAPPYLHGSLPQPPTSEPVFPHPPHFQGTFPQPPPLPQHPEWESEHVGPVRATHMYAASEEGLTAAPQLRRPTTNNDRNLNLPKFNGKANVDGFFAVFEMVVSGLTDDDATKARYLVSRLEGAAQQWLFG